MLLARTKALQAGDVMGRRISLVLMPSVLGVAICQVNHDAVSGGLGQHAGASNRCAVKVGLNSSEHARNLDIGPVGRFTEEVELFPSAR